MEVKAVMNLTKLPHIFEVDGVKMVAGDPNGIINCINEDCVIIKHGKMKKTKTIYYSLWDSLMTISFRKANKDVKEVLESILNLIPESYDKLLIKYNYFSIKVYDKFLRGNKLEFPLITEVNGIKIYRAVEPPGAYIYDSDMNRKLDDYQFHKTTYLWFYGNDIEFNKYIHEYLYLSSFEGSAELLYVPESVNTVISNADNKQELKLEPGWVLLVSKSD